jgi:hypothetical protein
MSRVLAKSARAGADDTDAPIVTRFVSLLHPEEVVVLLRSYQKLNRFVDHEFS